jgi:hypothetical protein
MLFIPSYSLLRISAAASSSMKQVFFNEKSNYYSRFGEPEPHCTA